MVQRRTRRVVPTVAASTEEQQEAPKPVAVRRTRSVKEAEPPVAEIPKKAPAAPRTEKRDPSSSSRVNYDGIIARYKERANTPKKAIRAMCIECMGGLIAEVDRCSSKGCALYPFRKGSNPYHKLSKEYKAEDAEE